MTDDGRERELFRNQYSRLTIIIHFHLNQDHETDYSYDFFSVHDTNQHAMPGDMPGEETGTKERAKAAKELPVDSFCTFCI
jgi:hypothetical protein